MGLQLLLVLNILLPFITSEVLLQEYPPKKFNVHNTSLIRPLWPRALDVDAAYHTAWCKGSKLLLATLRPESSASTFVTPVRSPWDGDLASAFSTWGYKEGPARDDLCDFKDQNLARAFGDLGIETASSADGGPNKCYHLEHQYGPTVERKKDGSWPGLGEQWYVAGGRRLRETQAITDLGINAAAGALYFFNRVSPKQAAHDNWGVPLESIKPEQLPDLAASSDQAWGFWNREHPNGVDIGKINKVLICFITNEVTLAIIQRAIDTYPLPPGMKKGDRPKGVERWPGITFEAELDVAQALLGTPNGQVVGYFLAQHKHRFGKSKTVDKVQVFRADKGMMPYMLFWVADASALPGDGDDGNTIMQAYLQNIGNITETGALQGEHTIE